MRHAIKRLGEGYLQVTSGLRMLPDFIIVGTQRGGTTSLYRYLAQHPSVAPTLVSKGVHFFDVEYTRSIAWYRGHFPPRAYRSWREAVTRAPLITGEASPYYLFHPAAAERAAGLVPHAKLIAMLRNPVGRAFSHYHHELEGGFETIPTFEEAIDAEAARLAGEAERLRVDPAYVSSEHQHHSYLSRGMYADQLRAWYEHFPKEQILVLTSEDFYRDTGAAYATVLEFLGLRTHSLVRTTAYNAHTYEPMRPETKARLQVLFRDPNRELAELLQRDPGWDVAPVIR